MEIANSPVLVAAVLYLKFTVLHFLGDYVCYNKISLQ